jgi:hypothetical protein
MRGEAIVIHGVDLKSHGLHQANLPGFLSWPDYLWCPIYRNKGTPNALCLAPYRAVLAQMNFQVTMLQPPLLVDIKNVPTVRPEPAAPFRDLSDENLRWLGLWLVPKRRAT